MLNIFRNDKVAKQSIQKIVEEMNANICCFTGHRSQKLPWRFNEDDNRYKQTRKNIKAEIEKSIERGY